MKQPIHFLVIGMVSLFAMLCLSGCTNWGSGDASAQSPAYTPDPANSPAQFPANY
ncbi:MAG: hypothetical protein P4L99_01445 [Chthoniobacter sp.]|nr:hypothetical protein [Chthoniobacter sp.]